MRPRPATFWARRCCRCWLDTSAILISRRCAATGPARASRHEENRQRRLGAARLRGDRGGGGRGVDAATSRPLPGAALVRALDTRHRYDGEAALWPSGRRGGGLQSEEARSTEPLLSHLLDGGHAIGLR